MHVVSLTFLVMLCITYGDTLMRLLRALGFTSETLKRGQIKDHVHIGQLVLLQEDESLTNSAYFGNSPVKPDYLGKIKSKSSAIAMTY